jgi:hypothetical protein
MERCDRRTDEGPAGKRIFCAGAAEYASTIRRAAQADLAEAVDAILDYKIGACPC